MFHYVLTTLELKGRLSSSLKVPMEISVGACVIYGPFGLVYTRGYCFTHVSQSIGSTFDEETFLSLNSLRVSIGGSLDEYKSTAWISKKR